MSSILKACYSNLQELKKDVYDFYSYNSFNLKIVTMLSLIFHDGKKYGFCRKYPAGISYMVCPLCEIPLYFWNYKDDLRKNRMDPVYMLFTEKSFYFSLQMLYHK